MSFVWKSFAKKAEGKKRQQKTAEGKPTNGPGSASGSGPSTASTTPARPNETAFSNATTVANRSVSAGTSAASVNTSGTVIRARGSEERELRRASMEAHRGPNTQGTREALDWVRNPGRETIDGVIRAQDRARNGTKARRPAAIEKPAPRLPEIPTDSLSSMMASAGVELGLEGDKKKGKNPSREQDDRVVLSPGEGINPITGTMRVEGRSELAQQAGSGSGVGLPFPEQQQRGPFGSGPIRVDGAGGWPLPDNSRQPADYEAIRRYYLAVAKTRTNETRHRAPDLNSLSWVPGPGPLEGRQPAPRVPSLRRMPPSRRQLSDLYREAANSTSPTALHHGICFDVASPSPSASLPTADNNNNAVSTGTSVPCASENRDDVDDDLVVDAKDGHGETSRPDKHPSPSSRQPLAPGSSARLVHIGKVTRGKVVDIPQVSEEDSAPSPTSQTQTTDLPSQLPSERNEGESSVSSTHVPSRVNGEEEEGSGLEDVGCEEDVVFPEDGSLVPSAGSDGISDDDEWSGFIYSFPLPPVPSNTNAPNEQEQEQEQEQETSNSIQEQIDERQNQFERDPTVPEVQDRPAESSSSPIEENTSHAEDNDSDSDSSSEYSDPDGVGSLIGPDSPSAVEHIEALQRALCLPASTPFSTIQGILTRNASIIRYLTLNTIPSPYLPPFTRHHNDPMEIHLPSVWTSKTYMEALLAVMTLRWDTPGTDCSDDILFQVCSDVRRVFTLLTTGKRSDRKRAVRSLPHLLKLSPKGWQERGELSLTQAARLVEFVPFEALVKCRKMRTVVRSGKSEEFVGLVEDGTIAWDEDVREWNGAEEFFDEVRAARAAQRGRKRRPGPSPLRTVHCIET